MAYTRTIWRTGETPLSAGNMNNIEDGIEEALNKIHISTVEPTSSDGEDGDIWVVYEPSDAPNALEG